MINELMNGREVNWNDKDLKLEVGAAGAAGDPDVDRGLRAEGARGRRPRRRRRDHPARRPRDHQLDHGHRAQGRGGSGARPGAAEVHRRRAEPRHRRPRRRARPGALVPGDGLEPRDGPDRALRHRRELVPKALTDYVQARKFYDYNDHSRVGAAHGEFVTDEICDRFCVIGNAEQIKAKLKELEAVGVDQFNVYLMTHGQEETLQAYGNEIIPQFAGVTA